MEKNVKDQYTEIFFNQNLNVKYLINYQIKN